MNMHVPEFIDILNSPEMNKYAACCPRCHTSPGELYSSDPDTIKYPCGSIFDAVNGWVEIHCEKRSMGKEMALFEAAMGHYLFAENKHQFAVSWDEDNDRLSPTKPPSFVTNQPVSYLLWDTDVFMSVIDDPTKAIGTIPEHHRDMNMVWILDRDVLFMDFPILAWFIHADERGITYGQVWQAKERLTEDPTIIWFSLIPWGEPIQLASCGAVYLLYSWLHQPYVSQVEGIKYSRQVRRAAERKGERLGNINVIEFRKPAARYAPAPADDGRPKRELHCCFERTGYSRRQPYGPRNSLRRIQWIAPTLVGDPSKPFKPKGQTLYRVTR